MSLPEIGAFWGLDNNLPDWQMCLVSLVIWYRPQLVRLVMEILRQAGGIPQVHGVLRLRSASPHFAQDDRDLCVMPRASRPQDSRRVTGATVAVERR
jgi:hypothetical protein